MAETNLSAVLAMATQRRDEARREAEAWDDFIRRLGILGGGQTVPSRPSIPDLPPREPAEGRQKRTDPAVAETIEATKTFLGVLGRPARLSEISAEMARLNVPVGGKDPKRTLDQRLRYSKAFKVVPGKGWWLADRPLPGQDDVAAADDHVEEPSQNLYRGGTL